ncbi:MAG: RNase III inhibitor, partial [Clostridia bacterium]|nr:RNase III inhibitor [Clostridia bacterium]
MDDTFGHFVTEIIDRKGLKDSDVYNKALLSRQVWNNIKNGKVKNPSKQTVCALILSLELDSTESMTLLNRAGYAFSKSSKFDLIIEYCIREGIYDVMKVNEILYGYDQPLLGTK